MKGLSLHIGLNKIDKKSYDPLLVPDLKACEFDAIDMENLAKKIGYETSILLSAQATYETVVQAIINAASQLKSGDIFLLTYSGHGSQVLDRNGDESDGLDETWVLYDRQIVDDELYELWSKFKAGVRIVVVSDSCHSGSVTRSGVPVEENLTAIKNGLKEKSIPVCQACGILLSGCQDSQVAMDGDRNGLFTQKLLEVWSDGKFVGAYRQFRDAIAAKLPKRQSPNYFTFGKASTNFYKQKPFTIK
ncbi:caspase family protein [Aerosakkonema sp. BLCC-F183]|uniref:caspase family protein n=1 Tax=Aerosakkonema sp. BLCC-F183 TaxID=3342834 RepID=UPI0035B854E1